MNSTVSVNSSLFIQPAHLSSSQLLELLSDCKRISQLLPNSTMLLDPFGPIPELAQPRWLQIYNFFFDVVLVGLILLAGITGNILSCFVLIRDRSHGTTSLILTCLAVSDTLFLIGCMFFQFLRTFSVFILWINYMNFYAHVSKFLYGAGMTVRMVRNWMVVLVTTERWVAVCKPLHAPTICTRGKARIAIICLCILCALYNIPHFLLVEAVPLFCYGSKSTEHVHQKETLSILDDKIPRGVLIYHSLLRKWVRENYPFRLFYRLIGYTVLIVALPTVIIGILNILLIRGIKYANARRAQIVARIDCANRQLDQCSRTCTQSDDRPNMISRLTPENFENHTYFVRVEKSTRSRSGEVNRLCVGVIVIYLICELPAVGYQVIHLLQHRGAIDITKPVTNALVCLNSGVNFFIYVFLGRRFRSQLKDMLQRLCCRWNRTHGAEHGRIVHSNAYHSSLGVFGGLPNQKGGDQLGLVERPPCKHMTPVVGQTCEACSNKGKPIRSNVLSTDYATRTSCTEI
ncbi:hypothetical protein CRM22_004673 [Opisthorchis felineus]|uniref:G-protein coupled receptors family 1 profile domain-containing protein n=1 Tax=Opisthorchis felineus TaxID=147828 RepID=A0A4S2LUY5_OPIFE|nr:hypothetical protein CRM22_004673 [Opisthorchis felineus]